MYVMIYICIADDGVAQVQPQGCCMKFRDGRRASTDGESGGGESSKGRSRRSATWPPMLNGLQRMQTR